MFSSSIIFTIYQFSDKAIAKMLFGYEGVAELMLLMQWSYTIIVTALQPLIALAYPSILQKDKTNARYVIFQFALLFSIITIIAVGTAAFFSNAISFIVPAAYSGIAEYMSIGFLAGGLFMIAQVFSIWFARSSNEHYYLKSVLIASFFGIPAIYILAANFGVEGILIGQLLFSAMYLTTCCYLFFLEN
jgi:O-antigen/teichoic acid export membrane protein